MEAVGTKSAERPELRLPEGAKHLLTNHIPAKSSKNGHQTVITRLFLKKYGGYANAHIKS